MHADWKLNGVCVTAENANDKQLLKDVHMTFKAGEITLLIGRNGAGKSTLLETMAGIRTIQSGVIALGEDHLWIEKTRRRSRLNPEVVNRLGISMQSAESQWFASSVREEMFYSLKPYGLDSVSTEERIADALAKVGLPAELLERDPWTLSGGQQRRLSLACLLACEPDWLLLDEPTAGLDAGGIRRLCAVLEAHRAAGRGAVVATHDLDALLPLADAVAVVSGGTVRAAAKEAAIAHAASAPQALRALDALREEAAMPLEQLIQHMDEAPWPTPKELASALVLELASRANEKTAPLADENSLAEISSGTIHSKPSIQRAVEQEQTAEVRTEASQKGAAKESVLLRSDSFDPRAIVLVYLFLSASIFAQKTALELTFATLLTVLLLIPFRTLIWPWRRVIRAYVIMIIIFCVIAGIGVSPLSFDLNKVWPIAIRLGKLLLIMILGLPMLKLMTPLRLQRSIEQTLGSLERLKVPIHSFAIIITLIFRFIPLLTGEWERFAKLAHARGKAVTPLKTVPIKRLLPILIPYVRSILRLAEQMADALEARGFGYSKRKPTYSFRLRFGRADARLMSIAAATGILLYLAAMLF
ncbi:ATP-binding cassette domain-containing protein [Bacillus sp. FJAT-28004]|uniref:ATP-binding cassette domain-containing protein n=1 Tax=Bacillus sp. FJAT-28004 TaxID=1679165 RepID=UPI0006B619C8|nr:ATP-binding cassette domain-containing protein [Bacillus sp. FJAT-28004]